jgi:hypothetical protein
MLFLAAKYDYTYTSTPQLQEKNTSIIKSIRLSFEKTLFSTTWVQIATILGNACMH